MPSLIELEQDPDFLALDDSNKRRVLMGIKEKLQKQTARSPLQAIGDASQPDDLDQARASVRGQVQSMNEDLDTQVVADTPEAPPPPSTAQQIADRSIQVLNRATPVQEPGFIDKVGNLANAGMGLVKQIPGAFEAELKSQQQNPLFNMQEMMIAGLGGIASTPTDLLNLATQAPAAIGNAWEGRQVYEPMFGEVYGARDIPGLKEIMDRHPVADFIGGAAVPVDMGIGALRGARAAKTVNMLDEAIPSGFVDRTGKEIIPGATPPPHGFVNRQGLEINPRLTPEEAKLAEPTLNREMLSTPEQVRDLNQGFQERTAQPVDLLDPRKADIPEEFGPVKTEATPEGLQIVTKAGQREVPQIEIASALPEGRKIEPTPPRVNPAEESASVLGPALDEIDTAKQLMDEAFNDLRLKEQALTRAAKVDDVVEAQRAFGSRINELEAKASKTRLTDGERQELAYRRGVYNDVLAARKNLIEAEALHNETTSQITPRASLETTDVNAPKPLEPTASNDILRQAPEAKPTGRKQVDMLSAGRKVEPDILRKPPGEPAILDSTGQPLKRDMGAVPGKRIEMLGEPKPGDPASLELPRPFERPEAKSNVVDMLAPKRSQVDPSIPKSVDKASEISAKSNVYKTPEGGEVYTHGRELADVQQQLAGFKGQIANISDIEKHVELHAPDAVPAVRNLLAAGKGSEASKFSYIAREAPGEPARVRDNFIPTHFTYETIKPATQRSYLRRKFGSDDSVISHLKQEIVNRGGQVDAVSLQNKSGSDVGTATQIGRLITQLDNLTNGAYLKSPRVHGINIGETTRSAAGDRGIRLDTITESSLTGRKVTPEDLQGFAYKNQIAPAMKALSDLADSTASPVFKRAVKQIQKGNITKQTMRELKAALGDEKLAAQFCSVFGVKL